VLPSSDDRGTVALLRREPSEAAQDDAHASRTPVIVAGRVARVRPRRDGGWRIRLADTGGALAAGEIRASNPLPLPRVGARILLRGAVRYDDEHGWYVVDPVEIWIEPKAR
jgi:hypothetical protein